MAKKSPKTEKAPKLELTDEQISAMAELDALNKKAIKEMPRINKEAEKKEAHMLDVKQQIENSEKPSKEELIKLMTQK